MSDEEAPLKAGHPPATKVGGMRVVQHKPPHAAEEEAAPAKDKEETEEEQQKEKVQSKTVVISGAVVKEKDVFSPEAAKAIHEKPQQIPNKLIPGGPNQGQKNMANLMQPRKS